MHIIYNYIINVYFNHYICNKYLLEERDKQQNIAVSLLQLLLPASQADCKTFCPMSRIGPITARPAPQRWISTQHFAPLRFVWKCFNVVLFGSNGNSYTVCTQSGIGIHTHVLHIMEMLVGQKKFGTAVDAACQGNLSAWHFGHASLRLVSPALRRSII